MAFFMYLKNGFTQSETMKLELNQYRSASDLLGEFLQDHTVRNSNSEVLQTSLFLEYKMWCERNSLHCVSKRTFTEQLNERGYQNRKSGANRYYVGLEISGAQ
jgi:phage/plasmid-associated DNA primase